MARQRGRRTDYQWANVGDVELGTDLAVAAALYGSTGLTFALPGTIMRIRGRIGCYLDAGAADENAMILVGLIVVDSDSFVSGAAPELFTTADDDASWIWQGALYVNSGVGVLAGSEEGQFDRIDVDTKAMRKIKTNSTLALVHQAPAGLVTDQAGTYDLTWYLHVLRGT